MLFYSFEFLYFFLPLVVLGYFLTTYFFGRRPPIVFLVIASFIFYANWNINHVIVLAASVVFNYALGRYLQENTNRPVLILSIFLNLCALGYYKYMNFFVDVVNDLANATWHVEQVILPLAISFYTFQQIAWLVDSYIKKVNTREEGFWRYALFVTFFPQLIAGPIVHHSEMMPQFSKETTFRISKRSIVVGLTIFIIGLFKKVVIADNLATFATPVFTDASSGYVPLVDSWVAALCFTLQIYFDFSGYSDMAIGLARLFNIRLPMNFNSPLRSTSMVDVWSRWHITMTRFFQAYLFTPFSVYLYRKQIKFSVKSNFAFYFAAFITFVAIGLWHGANWTFIAFGIMHGVFIVINHLWKNYRKATNRDALPKVFSIFLTFFFFMLSCVIYRAENVSIGWTMYESMLGAKDILVSENLYEMIKSFDSLIYIIGALIIVFAFPNTQQIMQNYRPVVNMSEFSKISRENRLYFLRWRPNILWLIILFTLYLLSFDVLWAKDIAQEFIYFQF